MTIQPARHEVHACYPLQAEKSGIQPVVGNPHGTHVEQVVSSFQKILRGSQLTWYITKRNALIVKMKHLFQGVLTCFGCETKTGVVRTLVIFPNLCSVTSMESSCGDLPNYMDKHAIEIPS